MKLQVPYFTEDAGLPLDQLLLKLDVYQKTPLSNHSWPELFTTCSAQFIIAHTGTHILLKFMVSHDFFRSADRKINGEVHLDNCVEFFLSFDNAETYYNIEFNCLGIGKMAYNSQVGGKTLLAEDSVRKILTYTKSGHHRDFFDWEMIWSIPAEVFTFHTINHFEGITASGNFYKCGDALPNPHYLSWNRVISEKPDFHRPECFGEIFFMPQMNAL